MRGLNFWHIAYCHFNEIRHITISIGQGWHSHAKYLIKVEKLTLAAPKIIIKNSVLFFSNIKYFGKTSNEWILNTTKFLIEA